MNTPLIQIPGALVLGAAVLTAAPTQQGPPLVNGVDLTGSTSAAMTSWKADERALLKSAEMKFSHNVFFWCAVPVQDPTNKKEQPRVEGALTKKNPPSGLQPRNTKPAVDPHTITDWPRRIAATDVGSRNDAWAQPDHQDDSWKSMTLPTHWETAGLPDYDGVVWFRRTIVVPRSMTKINAVLSLGAIDDMDVTWVNGARVGGYQKAGAHFTPRNYKLAAGILKPGKNLLAVRVMDHGWGGGMAATHGKMQLTAGGKTIPLSGSWRYRVGATLARLTGSGAGEAATSPRPKPFGGEFALRPHDVIAFAGGTTMVKQAEAGYLEAMLTGSTSDPVFFRDTAWQADTVYLQQRPRNFGTHLDLLERINASVVVAGYGQMETLDGAAMLPEFIAAYEKLLDQFAQRTPRIVLISPHPFEKTKNPNLPDLSIHNNDLAAYSEAIRQLARRRGFIFVDLAKLDSSGLTTDGVQLNRDGHFAWAQVVSSKLTGEKVSYQPHALDGMRREIIRKNNLWRQHWRPTNWSFLYGNRQHVPSSRDHRPGKPRWFPEEVDAIIPLIESAEVVIQSYQGNRR